MASRSSTKLSTSLSLYCFCCMDLFCLYARSVVSSRIMSRASDIGESEDLQGACSTGGISYTEKKTALYRDMSWWNASAHNFDSSSCRRLWLWNLTRMTSVALWAPRPHEIGLKATWTHCFHCSESILVSMLLVGHRTMLSSGVTMLSTGL